MTNILKLKSQLQDHLENSIETIDFKLGIKGAIYATNLSAEALEQWLYVWTGWIGDEDLTAGDVEFLLAVVHVQTVWDQIKGSNK